MIFDFLRRLGGAGAGAAEPTEDSVEYRGYTITPTPRKDAGGWRVAARIVREVDGELRSHEMVRADVFADRTFVVDLCVRKARQCVDEQGERLLEPRGEG